MILNQNFSSLKRRRVITSFILEFIFFIPFWLGAQGPYFKHYTTKDGLPSNTIYEIKQDHKGFLWLATNYGACRYDGNKFKSSFNHKGDLLDQDISNIFIDSIDRIWFVNMNCEISCYHNDTIYNYKNNWVLKKKIIRKFSTSTYKNSQYIDKNGNLIISLAHLGIYKSTIQENMIVCILREINTIL